MRGGSRKGFGGPQPNSGRPALEVPTKPVQVWLTVPQWQEFKGVGGSPWLQGLLNLRIREKAAREAEDGADLNINCNKEK